jgi:hypothetical protein
MERARKALLLLIAAVGAGSVGLRLYLNLTRHDGHSAAWRLVDFFSYFTNTTAILATATALLALARPASRLARPGVVAATAVYILVVAVTYQWLLRGDPHGLALVADLGLHQVLPTLVILLWVLFTPKAGLSWRAPLVWLAYPAVYIAWLLALGAVRHHYPYFFADVAALGYPRALVNGAAFLSVFYLLGLATVLLGRWPPRGRRDVGR